MKTNTSRKRTLSLFTQGAHLYAAIPNMKEELLAPLMQSFDTTVRTHDIFARCSASYEGMFQVGQAFVNCVTSSSCSATKARNVSHTAPEPNMKSSIASD